MTRPLPHTQRHPQEGVWLTLHIHICRLRLVTPKAWGPAPGEAALGVAVRSGGGKVKCDGHRGVGL